MSAPTPEELLDVARDLRNLVPPEANRPYTAHLRRAISTAYYAVSCALRVEIGKSHPGDLDRVASRLVSHSSARDVLANLQRKGGDGSLLFIWLPDRPVCDPDLVLFAQTFELLLKERESADYDYLWPASKKDAEDAINLAEEAIQQLERATANAPVQVRAICLAVIADSRSRKRMKF